MIGTRLDEFDGPRVLRSQYGWWFIGNRTWTLLRPDQVGPEGTVRADADDFLRREGAYRPRTPSSFSLTVLTSTACNLGCGYCFQNTAADASGGHRPLRIERQRLDSDTVGKIIAFTDWRMKQAGLGQLYLLLFGGEPLLNPSGCLELLRRSHEIGLDRAAMVSNGVLLRRALAVDLYGAGLRDVQITFDGSREDHDSIRVKRSGAATFDTIVRNVARATEATGLRWNLRVNVSHHNYERIGELFGQLKDQLDPTRCTVNFAWVGDAGFGYDNDLAHAGKVGDCFVQWTIAALEAGFRIVRPSMHTTCQICSEPGGHSGAVINADGTLYSCWQSAGKAGWDVGTIDSGYRDVDSVRDRWVTCGYEYRQADQGVVSSFQDSVDSRILDYLYTANRL
jgi:uncharacterized protein